MAFDPKPKRWNDTVFVSAASNISSHGKEKIMLARIVLSLLLLPMMAMANPPLPPIPEGLKSTRSGECSDNESGQKGVCIYLIDNAGERYMVFYQEGEVMFIRQVTPTGFVTIWMNDFFNTF